MGSRNKKVLITGASGLLGRAILREFQSDDNWEALGLAFSRAGDGLCKVDLRNFAAVRDVVKQFHPDFIVHSAAERRPDVVEKSLESSRQLNVDVTKNVALIAKEYNCRLLYISTDSVFDGTKPPYQPGDQTNPLNNYAKLKLEGERVTLESLPSSSGVLRVPYLYGEVKHLDECSFTAILKSVLNNNKDSKLSHYEKRYPTYVDDVAIVIRQIGDKILNDNSFHGIWHWSGSKQMTKYEIALLMGKIFNLGCSHLIPDQEIPPGALRAFNSQLDKSYLANLNFGRETPLEEGIGKCYKRFLNST